MLGLRVMSSYDAACPKSHTPKPLNPRCDASQRGLLQEGTADSATRSVAIIGSEELARIRRCLAYPA